LILREAAEKVEVIKKARAKRKRKLIKLLINNKVYEHQDGRQLYEMSSMELQQLLQAKE